MEAAHQLSGNEEIHFWFVGEGAMKEELIEQAGALRGKTVFFHPFMPLKEVMVVISQTQLSIVSLNPGVIDCAYPSKTMSYLEAGCKLLCLVEGDTSLASTVQSYGIGSVCSQPATPESVAEAISSEFRSWKDSGYDRDKIQKFGRSQFGQDVILGCWLQLIAGKKPTPPSTSLSKGIDGPKVKRTTHSSFVHSAEQNT